MRRDRRAGTDPGAARTSRAARATVAAVGARVVTTLGFFAAVRLAAPHLDGDRLGLFVLVVSSQALLAFADLGIGNGLLNVFNEAEVRGDRDRAVGAVSSAFATLAAVAVALVAGFAVLHRVVDWASLLNVDGAAAGEAGGAVAAFVVATAVALPFGVANVVYQARQVGWKGSLFQAGGAAWAIVAVAVVAPNTDSAAALAVAALSGPPVAWLACSIWLFAVDDPTLRPRWRGVERSVAGLLLRRGGLFLVLSLAVAVGYQTDAVVVSRYLGADDVADFAVGLRLFMVAPNLVWLGVAPLWPAYTEAVARDDVDWAHRALLRSLAVAAALPAAASAVLLVAAGPILTTVLDSEASPGTALLAAFAAWAVVSGLSTAVSAFLNAMGVLRLQAVASAAMAVTNIALSIALVQSVGVEGPVLASVATQTVLVLLPCAWVLRTVLRPTATSESLRQWVHRWGDVAPVQAGAAPARR